MPPDPPLTVFYSRSVGNTSAPHEKRRHTPMFERAPARTRVGDLWMLGPHRLLVGDSTHAPDLARLMNGQQADMLFTDPPYGVNYGNESGATIASDLTYTAIPLMFSFVPHVLKAEGWLYCFGGQTNMPLYTRMFERYLRVMNPTPKGGGLHLKEFPLPAR